MRRFLIWSALAVVIGLALAGAGYWAYWNFYARFQPVTISRNQAEIQRLLDEASWVSGGGGGEPLYVIGYRDSASTQRYEREEADKLRAGGVELRSIVFARPDREGQVQSTPAERATVAELWLSRDWSLYQRWTATPSRNWTAAGIPAADGNLARSAVVEASRQFTTRLNDLLRDAGAPTGYPLVIWRDRVHEDLRLRRQPVLGLHPRRFLGPRPGGTLRRRRARHGHSAPGAGPRRRHAREPALSEPRADPARGSAHSAGSGPDPAGRRALDHAADAASDDPGPARAAAAAEPVGRHDLLLGQNRRLQTAIRRSTSSSV